MDMDMALRHGWTGMEFDCGGERGGTTGRRAGD